MRRLIDRYILSELRGPFLFGIAVFTIALVAGRILDLSRLMVDNGAPLIGVAKILVLGLPGIAAMSFPMAMLVATLLSFGRLSADSEIIAMQAGGISLIRCLGPVIAMATIVSLAGIFLNETVVPMANSLSEAIVISFSEGKELKSKARNVLLQERGEKSSRIISADTFDAARKEMQGVSILEKDAGGRPIALTYARKAVWSGRMWNLVNGFSQRMNAEGRTYKIEFKRQCLLLSNTPEHLLQRRKRPEDMSAGEIRQLVAILAREGENTAPLMTQLHMKFAVPFASFIFALIGVPLGLKPHRSSSSMGVGLSLVIIFIYYVLMTLGLRLGQSGNMPPWMAAWMANGIVAVAGIVLIGRAIRQA